MFPIEALANVVVVFLLLFFWTGVFAVFYHLTRFGVGLLPKRLSALFLIGAVSLFCTSLILYQQVDLSLLLS